MPYTRFTISSTRLTCLLFCGFLLLSCQTSPETSHITRGNVISLNKTISIPQIQSHVIIQFGEIIRETDLKAYETSCIVDSQDLGPVSIQPQSYKVRKVTYNEEFYSDAGAIIRYFTEIFLTAGDPQQNLILTCQTLGDTMQHHSFPVNEIKQATRDYFIFDNLIF